MINESFYFWHPATTGEHLRITTSSDDSAILSSPQSSIRSTPPLSSVLFTPNLQSSLGSTPPKTEWDRVQLNRGTKMPVYNEEDFYILTQVGCILLYGRGRGQLGFRHAIPGVEIRWDSGMPFPGSRSVVI